VAGCGVWCGAWSMWCAGVADRLSDWTMKLVGWIRRNGQGDKRWWRLSRWGLRPSTVACTTESPWGNSGSRVHHVPVELDQAGCALCSEIFICQYPGNSGSCEEMILRRSRRTLFISLTPHQTLADQVPHHFNDAALANLQLHILPLNGNNAVPVGTCPSGARLFLD